MEFDLHEKYLINIILLKRQSNRFLLTISIIILGCGLGILSLALLADFNNEDEYWKQILTACSILVSLMISLPLWEIFNNHKTIKLCWELKDDSVKLRNQNPVDSYSLGKIRDTIWKLTEKYL